MKSKAQKQEELKEGKALLAKSGHVLLFDYSKVGTKDLSALRRELKTAGNPLFVIKKRLLGLLFKDRGIEFRNADYKVQVGAVFASNLESAAASVVKFFKGLEKEKKIEGEHVLGGFDLAAKAQMPAADVIAIGLLPPRDVLLAQLAAMIAAPVKSLLYILQQKSEQTRLPETKAADSGEQVAAAAPKEAPKAAASAAAPEKPAVSAKAPEKAGAQPEIAPAADAPVPGTASAAAPSKEGAGKGEA